MKLVSRRSAGGAREAYAVHRRQGLRRRASRASSSCTARCTTTASGRCWRAGSRTTATRCSRPTCPAMRAATARRSRASRRSPTGCSRCSTPRGVAAAALVGHSMGSLIALEAGARAPRTRAPSGRWSALAYPMKVSAALLDAARDAIRSRRSTASTPSRATLAAKPAYPGPGAWLHGADRALMRRMQAAQREINLFLNDFEVCDRYRGGLAAAARRRLPGRRSSSAARDQMTRPGQAARARRRAARPRRDAALQRTR